MLPDKTVLVVYSVHLKTNSGGVYVVIGGDFKSDPTSEKWDEGYPAHDTGCAVGEAWKATPPHHSAGTRA